MVRSVNAKQVIVKVNDQIDGMLRTEECPATVKEGDTLEAYVTLHESRNYLLPLSMSKSSGVNHAKKEFDRMAESQSSDSGSLGDLIKRKMGNTDAEE